MRALLSKSTPDEDKAFTLLEELLSNDPFVPEYRFQYATLLGAKPKLYRQKRITGVEPNAIVLLTELAQKYPEHPEYGVSLIKILLRNLNYVPGFRIRYWNEIGKTVTLSEQMLSKFPNDPELTEKTIALHLKYIGLLREREIFFTARQCFDRLLTVLEVLFYNPEVSDIARENLIELQFKRAAELNRRSGQAEVLAKIERELQLYKGQRQKEFQEKYAELTQLRN